MSENKTVYDWDKCSEFICEHTGVDRRTVEVVLDSEWEYMKEIGVVEECNVCSEDNDMGETKYISETEAILAVQKVLIELGYEPLGDDAQKLYQALTNVDDYLKQIEI